jgi:hypothetical protein
MSDFDNFMKQHREGTFAERPTLGKERFEALRTKVDARRALREAEAETTVAPYTDEDMKLVPFSAEFLDRVRKGK